MRLKLVSAAGRPQAGDPSPTSRDIMVRWARAVRMAAIVEWRARPWQEPELSALLGALDRYHRDAAPHG